MHLCYAHLRPNSTDLKEVPGAEGKKLVAEYLSER